MKGRWSIFLILLALVAETAVLLNNLHIIELPFLKRGGQKLGQKEAGYVVRSRQSLKRRSSDSLIWEDTREQDRLYYKDSLLTLSQSEATLYLKDQTELHLSENTLVSLEEPENTKTAEIRLRFSKGDLRARNPSLVTQLKDDTWSVTLEKGSEVSVRKNDGEVEFELLQGEAQVQSASGAETLKGSEILKIDRGELHEKVKKTQDLRWKNPEPHRIYTNHPTSEALLEWEGLATKIVLQRLGQEDQVIDIPVGQKAMSVSLSLGNYTMRLADTEAVSQSKRVEIWQAPSIYLRKPLPRDRLRTEVENEFVWSLMPEVKEYRLRIFSEDRGIDKSFSNAKNFVSLQWSQEGDFLWNVEGVDQDGFTIPGSMPDALYFRSNPLEAPKLKAPTLRKPSSPEQGSFYRHCRPFVSSIWSLTWCLMTQPASAAEQAYEALFEWEPVPGADQYTIEISATAGFHNPEVAELTRDPHFVWKKSGQGTYYWRVAAGTAGGRMGIFSNPVQLRFEDLKFGEERQANGVTVKNAPPIGERKVVPSPIVAVLATPTPIPTPIPTPLPTPTPEPPKVAEPTPTPEPVIPRRARTGFAWSPALKTMDLRGPEDVHAQVNGVLPQGIYVEHEWFRNESELWSLRLQGFSQAWKPKGDLPFQSDLRSNEIWINLEQGDARAAKRWGAVLHLGNILERTGFESINVRPLPFFGFSRSYAKEYGGHWDIQGTGSVLISSGAFEAVVEGKAKLYLNRSDHRLYAGFGTRGQIQSVRTVTSSEASLYLFFGFDFIESVSEND